MSDAITRDFERISDDSFRTLDELILYLRHVFAYRYAAAQLPRDPLLLDFGCGAGYGTAILSEAAKEAVGVDADADALAHARKAYSSKKCRFELLPPGQVRLPFEDDTFDAAVSFQVIEHIPDDAACIAEIHRVLKPGGIFVLTTPNRTNRLRPGAAPWNPFHLREYYPDELSALLGRVFAQHRILGVRASAEIEGLEAVRVRNINRLSLLDPLVLRRHIPKTLIPSLVRWLERLRLLRHSEQVERETAKYRVEDFYVSEDKPELSLDLLAVCRKQGPSAPNNGK